MINRAYIELATVKECSAIARIDGVDVSSDIKRYVSDNLLTYYIATNTWLMIVEEVSTPAFLRLKSTIMSNGLIKTIGRFAEGADELVHGKEITDSLVRNVVHDIMVHYDRVSTQFRNEPNRDIWSDPMAAALFICRYAKRFSPLHMDLYDKKVMSDFLANQNRIKLLQRRPVSHTILSFAREAMKRIPFDLILQDIRSLDDTDLCLTHGVGFDAKAPLVSKLKALSVSCPNYFYQPFGVNMTPVSLKERKLETFGAYDDPVHEAKVSCVPKNYKTNRLIATEDTYRQAYARAMFNICDRYLPSNLSLHDQMRNQILARESSLSGDYATLDLHAASDSVSWVLCQELLPTEFCYFLKQIRPTHVLINGKRKPIYAFATMGNAETFFIETIIIWAICTGACYFAQLFGIENDCYVSVYGDDIVCPTATAEIAIEWLESCGFIVNSEKSFYRSDDAYRESCGEEYHLGTCVSSQYYPRFCPRGTIDQKRVVLSNYQGRDGFTNETFDSVSRLVDLQHKLAYLSDKAGLFLAEIIKQAKPQMTSSPFGEICQDLWEYESRPVLGRVPLGEIVSTKVLQSTGINKYTTVEKRSISRRKSEQTREGHMIRVDSFPTVAEDPLGSRLYDLYKYQEFLKHGPTYDSLNIDVGKTETVNFNQLAGISRRPVPFNKVASQAKSNWVIQF